MRNTLIAYYSLFKFTESLSFFSLFRGDYFGKKR